MSCFDNLMAVCYEDGKIQIYDNRIEKCVLSPYENAAIC